MSGLERGDRNTGERERKNRELDSRHYFLQLVYAPSDDIVTCLTHRTTWKRGSH